MIDVILCPFITQFFYNCHGISYRLKNHVVQNRTEILAFFAINADVIPYVLDNMIKYRNLCNCYRKVLFIIYFITRRMKT